MANPGDIQKAIVEEFEILQEDREQALEYIMELGDSLEPYPEEERDENHLIKGCQSKVWLSAKRSDQGGVQFHADSNTAITKGLIALLIRVYGDQQPQVILHEEPWFLEAIGMGSMIGTQRSNGLKSMIGEIKKAAALYQNLNH